MEQYKFKPIFHYVCSEKLKHSAFFWLTKSLWERDIIAGHNKLAEITDEMNFYETKNSAWDFDSNTDEEYMKYIAAELRKDVIPKVNASGVSKVLKFDVDDENANIIGKFLGNDNYIYYTLKQV